MDCLGVWIFASVYLVCMIGAAITGHDTIVIFMILIPFAIAESYAKLSDDS